MKDIRTAFVVYDLAKLITSCKHAYYNGSRGISDEDYDKLEYVLLALCPDHPILQVVGVPGENYKNPKIEEIKKMMRIE